MQSLRERFELVAGPAPVAVPERPRFEIQSETQDSGLRRIHLRLVPEAGDALPAWLLAPLRPRRKAPAVLCLHQTTKIGKDEPAGLGGKPNLHYARELALRGYVALCPDYPNFGEYSFDAYAHGYASTTRKGILNHSAAVSLLRAWPGVDPNKIAVCGHSLGGHNAIFLAAFDARVRAVLSSCGFTSFAKYKGGDLTGWSHRGYMPRIAERYGKDPKQMPFDFSDLLREISPRPVFVNAPIGDDNFDWSGVDDAVRLSGHKRILVEHPDCGHDFPPEVRQRAYAWLDRVL